MANTDTKTVTEPTDTAPAKRGRKSTRDPNGKSVTTFFSQSEYATLRKARFARELDKDADLVRAAVLAYLS